jgi:hypothetical protein
MLQVAKATKYQIMLSMREHNSVVEQKIIINVLFYETK